MTQNHTTGMKAIWGIVLMVNLAMVPFYNAAIAKGNNDPVPYTPDTTPEWSFGMEEGTVAVLGAVGVMGAEVEVSLQPELEDPAIQDLLDFHVLAFETVFGRAYDGTESAYFFEQPLDELTYATVVPGWNTVGEPVDALVLLAQPIDVSDIVPENGVTIISTAHIAGTLEGIDKQGFWGISMVYDFHDGVRYNDLFLLSELDETAEMALLANAGLMDYGRGDPDEMEECTSQAENALDTCLADVATNLRTCSQVVAAALTAAIARCLYLAMAPGAGWLSAVICIGGVSIIALGAIVVCTKRAEGALDICYNTFKGDLLACGWILAKQSDILKRECIARNSTHNDVIGVYQS